MAILVASSVATVMSLSVTFTGNLEAALDAVRWIRWHVYPLTYTIVFSGHHISIVRGLDY